MEKKKKDVFIIIPTPRLVNLRYLMLIPLIIGKNSNGENQIIDLAEMPLLMVSYCRTEQLQSLYSQLQSLQYPFKQKDYYISSKRKYTSWDIELQNSYTLFKDDPDEGSIKSKAKMLKLINDEISRRERILKNKKSPDFKRYFSLNTWQTEKLSYQFFVIDDIWDLIISKPKSLGLSLMHIILYGGHVGIHTIFTSSLSYRNLLEQLININPSITKELQKKYGVPEPQKINSLGSELILTAENLVFYKRGGATEMERMYLAK